MTCTFFEQLSKLEMPEYWRAVSGDAANLLSVLGFQNNPATTAAAVLVLSSLTASNFGANGIGSPCSVDKQNYAEVFTFFMYYP